MSMTEHDVFFGPNKFRRCTLVVVVSSVDHSTLPWMACEVAYRKVIGKKLRFKYILIWSNMFDMLKRCVFFMFLHKLFATEFFSCRFVPLTSTHRSLHDWVVVSIMFYVHLENWGFMIQFERWHIFLKWVGSTNHQLDEWCGFFQRQDVLRQLPEKWITRVLCHCIGCFASVSYGQKAAKLADLIGWESRDPHSKRRWPMAIFVLLFSFFHILATSQKMLDTKCEVGKMWC